MERPFYSDAEWSIGMLITVNMLGKTRWKWGGHVGVRNYLSYKRQKARAISLLCALSPSFETNLPAFIKCSTVKYNRRPHNQGQNVDTCKTILWVCECSLIKITFRPITIGFSTFNTTVFSISKLIKLCYFKDNNKLRFLEWFNKLRNVERWHGRPCSGCVIVEMETQGRCWW